MYRPEQRREPNRAVKSAVVLWTAIFMILRTGWLFATQFAVDPNKH